MSRHSSRELVLVTLVLGGLAIMFSAPAAQQQESTGAPAATPPAGRGNFANNFTGTITVGNTKDMSSSRIKFEAGARTNWHIHSTAQLLLVEEGRGRLQELGSEIRDVPAGQPVLTKPNVLHWHGAPPDQAALQFRVHSGTLDRKSVG